MEGWRKHRWEQIQKDDWRKWKPWFAWRPVRTVSGRVMWCTTVYRKLANTYSDDMDMPWYFYGDAFDILRYV